MPDSIRRCSNPTTVRACVNCQKRKSRCMRGSAANDPCSYCAKTGKTCSFEKPPDRTPLTRKNLDAAELRCKQLQGLIKSLNPELDINSAFEETQVQQDSVGHEDDGGGGSLHSPPGDSDEVTPHSYEWHEGSLSPEFKSSTHENDGMAMLPTHDSGYLGKPCSRLACGRQLTDERCLTSTFREQFRFPVAWGDRLCDSRRASSYSAPHAAS